jgi:hypothetical protein
MTALARACALGSATAVLANGIAGDALNAAVCFVGAAAWLIYLELRSARERDAAS